MLKMVAGMDGCFRKPNGATVNGANRRKHPFPRTPTIIIQIAGSFNQIPQLLVMAGEFSSGVVCGRQREEGGRCFN